MQQNGSPAVVRFIEAAGRAQIRDILAGDKQLADELLYDLKQDERARAATAAAAASAIAAPGAARADAEPASAAVAQPVGEASRAADGAACDSPGQGEHLAQAVP